MYRQGDVLIEEVKYIPSDATEITGEIILAHGEATGHAHRIKSKAAKLFDKAGERFLKVSRAVQVVHDEHEPISLPCGNYRIIRQVEYTPEAIINVAD